MSTKLGEAKTDKETLQMGETINKVITRIIIFDFIMKLPN
jgi:hypothetical protein